MRLSEDLPVVIVDRRPIGPHRRSLPTLDELITEDWWSASTSTSCRTVGATRPMLIALLVLGGAFGDSSVAQDLGDGVVQSRSRAGATPLGTFG